MVQWYWHDGSAQHGPCTVAELRQQAAAGRVGPETLVWRDGQPNWQPASSIPGLLLVANDARPAPPPSHPSASQGGSTSPGAGRESRPAESPPLPSGMQFATAQAAHILADLQALNFREEVVPLDESNLKALTRSYVFWSAALLGVVPLLIGTFDNLEHQRTAFALFFAALWGVIFKSFIVPLAGNWVRLLIALFFTGIAGIFGLLFIYRHALPVSYLGLADSKSAPIRLLGYVFQVGLWEELCKSIPVIFYVWRKGKDANPMLVVLLGVFSGLGFAAFENIQYGERSLAQSALLTQQHGVQGAQIAAALAVTNAMLRALSLVFCHAIWAGIVAYFLAMAARTGKRWGALFLVGLGTASLLHGVYDWLVGMQQTFAAAIVVVSFMLFFAYMTKLRALTAQDSIATAAASP